MIDVSEVPVFVLCGGLGTRLKEETELRPKPMVPVGDQPTLWHIMRTYGRYGFKRFVLCLGFKAEVIKSYFLNYSQLNSDFTVDLATDGTTVHSVDHGLQWQVNRLSASLVEAVIEQQENYPLWRRVGAGRLCLERLQQRGEHEAGGSRGNALEERATVDTVHDGLFHFWLSSVVEPAAVARGGSESAKCVR